MLNHYLLQGPLHHFYQPLILYLHNQRVGTNDKKREEKKNHLIEHKERNQGAAHYTISLQWWSFQQLYCLSIKSLTTILK